MLTQAETRESALRAQSRTVKLEATLFAEGDAQCQHEAGWMTNRP